MKASVGISILEILGTEVEPDTPLMAAGIDSLGATELQRALSESLCAELEATLLFDHPSVDGLVSYLVLKSSRDSVSINKICIMIPKYLEP